MWEGIGFIGLPMFCKKERKRQGTQQERKTSQGERASSVAIARPGANVIWGRSKVLAVGVCWARVASRIWVSEIGR